MSSPLSPLAILMSPLLPRAAGAAGILVFAAAVAVSAPLGHPLTAQSSKQTESVRSEPDRVPRRATATPATSPTAVQPVPAVRPAVPVLQTARPVARQTVVGGGQLALINQDRVAAGLSPLLANGCLAAIAAQNAARMAAAGYISHANGTSLDLGCHLGLRAGENVGYLSNGINDAEMNAMFMASPAHRANILGPYRYVGVAWVVAGSGAAFIAVEFS